MTGWGSPEKAYEMETDGEEYYKTKEQLIKKKIKCKILGCNKGITDRLEKGLCHKHYQLSLRPIGIQEFI